MGDMIQSDYHNGFLVSSWQVCEGMDGGTKHSLAIPSKLRVRSWQISPNGTKVVVGYVEGALQVSGCVTVLIHAWFSQLGTVLMCALISPPMFL